MNLLEFKFPSVDKADLAFPTFGTIPELLMEAEKRGFTDSHNPYNRLFNKLFFTGGKVKFKTELSEQQNNMWLYCRSFMRSFFPKHEHKEAICAMLLSELVEPELQ